MTRKILKEQATSKDGSGSRSNNTTSFCDVNMDSAVYAVKMLLNSKRGLRSTMITSLAKSGDCSVPTVTGIYWDGTEVVISLEGWPNISTKELAGLYLHKDPPAGELERKRRS